jgi:hypothetical protein
MSKDSPPLKGLKTVGAGETIKGVELLREWQVEDAGGGCRAFSEVIVLACLDTGEVFSSTIPLTWDDGFSLEEKACSQLIQMMLKAHVEKDDFFYVCSGNIFHRFHNWLNENDYSWEICKIDGFAHEHAEHLFHCQVVAAGFPAYIRLVERNYRDYYRAVEKWIYADEKRLALLKDREVRQKPAETRYVLKGNGSHTRSCHKCGEKIIPYTPIVVYRCRESGRKVRRYFHPACTPVKPLKSTLESATITWSACNVEGIVLGAGKENRQCTVCGQPVLPGEKSFYGYWAEKVLIAGHLSCFLNGNKPFPPGS